MTTKKIRLFAATLTSTLVLLGAGPFVALADNPMPTTTSISPIAIVSGSGAFTLTVNGNNFVPGSTVYFNGQARTTTYVSSTQLSAVINASDLATLGTYNVSVTTAGPGGGTSNAQAFVVGVNSPVPSLVSISPSAAAVGSGSFTMTANGSNFVPSSKVLFNGLVRSTNYVSSNQLTAVITAADVGTVISHAVAVANPIPGGGTSNYIIFTINPIAGIPSLPNTGFGPEPETPIGLMALAAMAVLGGLYLGLKNVWAKR